MFSEELEKYSWEETTREIYSKTAADVELALSKSQLAIDDFMALISPAAEKYLEPMAALSQKYTLQRFGKTISMYIPLYITNSCTNFCVYCGFNHNNPLPTRDCVHTGAISRAGQSIVCLPAQVVVHLEGASAPDAPDVIVG